MQRTEQVKQYYTCLDLMKFKFDQFERKSRFQAKTVQEYEVWKKETKKLLGTLIGLDHMIPCDLNPVLSDKIIDNKGITSEKLLIQTEPGVYMPANILTPLEDNKRYNNKNHKALLFIALPGHLGGGRQSVAGRVDIPAIKEAVERFNYDYGYQMARLGYTVICPDCRGFGERREEALQGEEEAKYMNGTCYQLSHMAEPLGETVIGMLTWDIMKLLDYIDTQDQYDKELLGCMGFSGGGMQTLWASALDDRIHRSIISGYLYGYKDSLLQLNGNCNCNYVPHLYEHLDMGDIGALLAPNALMIQSCRNDHLNGPRGLMNVYEQVRTIQAAYQLSGVEDKIFHDIQEGEHCWHGDFIANFLYNSENHS